MPRLAVPPGSLEIFAEAARLRSFKNAAATLALSTSAVSQAMRKLEERLGCALFARTRTGVALTAQGERLLRHVDEGFRHIRLGLDAVRRNAERPLSFTSPPGIAAQILGPALVEIMTHHDSDIRIAADEAPDFESYHDYDVAILYGAGAQKLRDVEPLGPDVFAPVCAPDLAREVTDVTALSQQLLLTNETNAVSWEDWFTENDADWPGPRRLHYNRVNYIMPSLLRGAGVALESLRLLSPHLARGELTVCAPPGTRPIIRDLTYLYVTPNRSRRARVREIADLIRQRCRTGTDGILLH
ncbi:LysR family transcriptional regulator [Paenirhodobacter sp.]|uniref:LysR family transcriptional regulator n=1 Tax=Paenirhodobacter sp. TaxID=1965326 RepID=UPI003B413BD0